MSVRAHAIAVGVAASLGAILGCGRAEKSGALLTVASTVSTLNDTLSIRLSQSPTVASLSMPAAVSTPAGAERLDIPAEIGSAHIADIAALSDGRVALLLRDLHEVVIVDDGVIERRFGRKGRGPGEFRDPLAIEANDEAFAVLDIDGIELFSLDGASIGRVRLPWLPDWGVAYNSRPLLYHQAPYQSGPEDPTRRIARYGSDFAIIAGERGERVIPPEPGTRQYLQLALLRLDVQTLRSDSVLLVRGAERSPSMMSVSDGAGRPLTNVVQPVSEPLFGARPLVAGSADWLAVFDPALNVIGVSSRSDSLAVVVSWPSGEVAVSDSVRAIAVDWQSRDLISAARSDSLAGAWARNARRQSFDQKIRASQSTPFSDSLASLAAMFATSRCLWLIGLDPRDFTDGTGHWGVAVVLTSGTGHQAGRSLNSHWRTGRARNLNPPPGASGHQRAGARDALRHPPYEAWVAGCEAACQVSLGDDADDGTILVDHRKPPDL